MELADAWQLALEQGDTWQQVVQVVDAMMHLSWWLNGLRISDGDLAGKDVGISFHPMEEGAVVHCPVWTRGKNGRD